MWWKQYSQRKTHGASSDEVLVWEALALKRYNANVLRTLLVYHDCCKPNCANDTTLKVLTGAPPRNIHMAASLDHYCAASMAFRITTSGV